MSGLPSVLVSLVSLGLLVLGVVTCVSVIRLSTYIRSGGKMNAIWPDKQQEWRPHRRPTQL